MVYSGQFFTEFPEFQANNFARNTRRDLFGCFAAVNNCIEFYFGNIDIRHHLCRQDNPEQATKELVRKYVEQARAIANFHNATIRLYEPLPIENPSRKIPKTGWHKGAPFCGDWPSRNFVRKLFRELGLVTRDPRAKERKKVGLKKARKASQFSKR